MSEAAEMITDLRSHLALCQELLHVVEREGLVLRTPGSDPAAFEFYQLRKSLLLRLDKSLAQLRKHRACWQKLNPEKRQQNPEVSGLLRLTQDLIMKVVMLDRENEKNRLRQGLLPANQLPSANRQRPHFVAETYRRHSAR